MRPSLHPKPCLSLRLVVQLSAGLLVPLWVAPALAQGVAAITPSPAMAPREEREKLAPLVMAPAAAELMRAEGTANQLAWRESLKRMSEAEADDPSRALAAYKRFFNERTMSPELGVEVGVKIAQLRSKLGDSKGALQTCEVLAAKYADEPTAALLSLQKARVLMESKQLAQASECVNEAMPDLVALGPSRYREISDLLLQLVQANLDSGDAESKERAKVLCVGVEEVYLRWLKSDTVDHLRERFEFLQTNYRRIGEQEEAEELFPKVVDVLLQLPVDPNNGEAGVMSLQMAQRLYAEQGGNSTNTMSQDERDAAFQLYTKAALSSDDYHSAWSIVEEYSRELNGNSQQAELRLLQLQEEVKTPSARLATQFMLAWARYKAGDWNAFLIQAGNALKQYSSINDHSRHQVFAPLALRLEDACKWAKLWQTNSVVAESPDLDLIFDKPLQQPIERRIFVDTSTPIQLQVAIVGDAKRVSARLEESPWAPELEEVRHQQIIVVTITPGLPQIQASICVMPIGQPEQILQLPFRVSAEATKTLFLPDTRQDQTQEISP